MHLGIIALTLLDLGVVVTELILSSIYPVREEAPHPGGWPGSAAGPGAGARPGGRAGGRAAWALLAGMQASKRGTACLRSASLLKPKETVAACLPSW